MRRILGVVSIVAAGVVLALLTGCAPELTAFVRVFNESAGSVYALVESPDRDPVEISVGPKVGSEDSFQEGVFTFGENETSIPITVTISGDFKTPQVYTRDLVRPFTQEFVVQADIGNVGFLNHSADDVLWAWLVPGDPVNYTSRAEVEAAAVYTVQNLLSEGYDCGRCVPGTYFVIYELADGYYYTDVSVVVALNVYVNASVEAGTAHPSL